jgi:hypothetical protein
MRFLLIFLLVPLVIPLTQASAISCIKPIPYGDFQGDVLPAISNPECKNVTLFYDVKSDTDKEKYDSRIEFQVLNKLSRVVPHSTIQIMIKNGTTTLFTDTFHTHSGYLNINLKHDNNIDLWNYIANPTDKSVSNWHFNNDEIYTIQTPRLEYGRFDVEARILTVYDDTYNFSPKGTPKFEFQLLVDQNGNISEDRNNLRPKVASDTIQKCKDTALGAKYGTPIDLEYDIHYGTVVSICKLEDTNSVITEINAEKDGQIMITIPKKVVHSLSSTDCADDSELLVLMDDEEVLPFNYIHSKKDNIITVKFSKGIHTIEFIGFTVMPDPSPAQYCGIIMGLDSLYLPPKFQIEKGMKPEQVRCNDKLVLIIKSTDASPACVKPETGKKLLERSWTKCTGSPVEVRGNPCGPHSSGVLPFDSNSKSESNSSNTNGISESNLPSDFSFVYSFGTDGKNVFDSKQNHFRADMVCDPPIEISINLSDAEKQRIWQSVT